MTRFLGRLLLFVASAASSAGAATSSSSSSEDDVCGLFSDSSKGVESAEALYDCTARHLQLPNSVEKLRSKFGIFGFEVAVKGAVSRLWHLRRDDLATKIFKLAKQIGYLPWPNEMWSPTVWVATGSRIATDPDAGKEEYLSFENAPGVYDCAKLQQNDPHFPFPMILRENQKALTEEVRKVPGDKFKKAFEFLDRSEDGNWESLWVYWAHATFVVKTVALALVYQRGKWAEEICGEHLPILCEMLRGRGNELIPASLERLTPSIRNHTMNTLSEYQKQTILSAEESIRGKSSSNNSSDNTNTNTNTLQNLLEMSEEVLLLKMTGSTDAAPHCGRINIGVNVHFTLWMPPEAEGNLYVGRGVFPQKEGSMYCFNDGMRHAASFTNPGKERGTRIVLVIRALHFLQDGGGTPTTLSSSSSQESDENSPDQEL